MRNEVLVGAVKYCMDCCHEVAVKSGRWNDIDTGESLQRDFGELIALAHSELSEAMDANCKNLNDDKLPHHKGATVELADALICIFDMAGALELDLGAALAEKLEFNAQRAAHKLEAWRQAHGKKY